MAEGPSEVGRSFKLMVVTDPFLDNLLKSSNHPLPPSEVDLTIESDAIRHMIEEAVIAEHIRELDEPANEATPATVDRELSTSEVLSAIGEALLMNKHLMDVLTIFEVSLKAMLSQVEEDLKDVKDRVKAPNTPSSSGIKFDRGSENMNFYTKFKRPYFKDKFGFSCPPNEDQKQRMLANRPEFHSLEIHLWNAENMKSLEKEIKATILKQIEKSRTKGTTGGEIGKHAPISALKKTPLSYLCSYFENFKVDWMNLSVKAAKGVFSDGECRRIWELYLHPKYSRCKWDAEESKNLLSLVESHDYQNWDLIAGKLGTNRSPFQCFLHSNNITKLQTCGKWTPEEDSRLISLVGMAKTYNHISWNKVAYFFNTRTAAQLYSRYMNYLAEASTIKKGKFTVDEHEKLLMGIRKYGCNFTKIASLFPNRNSAQIRSVYTQKLKPVLEVKHGDWSVDEDKLLLDLIEQYGECQWAKIASELKTRTRTQIRHRYTHLKKKMAEQNDFDVEKLRRVKRKNNMKTTIVNKRIYKKIMMRLPLGNKKKTTAAVDNNILKVIRMNLAKPYLTLPEEVTQRELDVMTCASTVLTLTCDQHKALNVDDTRGFTLTNAIHISPEFQFRTVNLFPPTSTTMLGLKNVLACYPYDIMTKDIFANRKNKQAFFSARVRWIQRFVQIFLWPLLLSKIEPDDVFEDI